MGISQLEFLRYNKHVINHIVPGSVLHTGMELVAFILLFAIFRVLEMTKMYVYFCFHFHFTYEAKEVSNEAKWFNVTHPIRDRIATHIHVF